MVAATAAIAGGIGTIVGAIAQRRERADKLVIAMRPGPMIAWGNGPVVGGDPAVKIENQSDSTFRNTHVGMIPVGRDSPRDSVDHVGTLTAGATAYVAIARDHSRVVVTFEDDVGTVARQRGDPG